MDIEERKLNLVKKKKKANNLVLLTKVNKTIKKNVIYLMNNFMSPIQNNCNSSYILSSFDEFPISFQ